MNLYKFILSSICPDHCPYCDKVIKQNQIACKKCKSEFPSFTATRFAKGGYRCYSPFIYKGNYSQAVKNLKFHDRTDYSEKLAYPMADTVNKMIKDVEFDFITCVPMHKKKLNERGYNQAKCLAMDLSKLINVPYIDALEKIKNNKEQHKCLINERRQNVKGVYKTSSPNEIKGKNLLIVDDIITSGYTLGECCKTLEKSNANKIYCITVCATNH